MADASSETTTTIDVDLVVQQFDAVDTDTHRKALLEAVRARDVYRKLSDELMEKVAKLERGLISPKSQRFKGDDGAQLSLAVLAELLGEQVTEDMDADTLSQQLVEQAEADAEASEHTDGEGQGEAAAAEASVHRNKRKPTGRKTGRERLHKTSIEVVPDEVERLGTDAFERIGEERSVSIERYPSTMIEVTVIRPKFRAKTSEAQEAVKLARIERGVEQDAPAPASWITTAAPVSMPIERGMAGPALLANVIVRRFDDHLPYNRLENVYDREGMRLGRSTLYGWLDALRPLLKPLIDAMTRDARASPYLCTDATGVLVQAPDKCSRGHFWVLVAPGKHVLFFFSNKHDGAAADAVLGDYAGHIVADAHSVYDHLYGDDKASEVGCWSHARKYFFQVIGSEPQIAEEFLANLRVMFLLERRFAEQPRKKRERMRNSKVKRLVDRHFELCRKHEGAALDGTPLAAAIRYSLNQEQALRRFLGDGRLPATNNISERHLRRQATGRKNWLFIGSDDGAEVNTTCSSLIASCHLHDIEPEAYLRDLLLLLPDWPLRRVLELAPCNWKQTRQQPDTQQLLDDHPFTTIFKVCERHLPTA